MDSSEDLRKQLNDALSESARLRAENTRLKKLLGLPIEETPPTLKITFAEPPIVYSPSDTHITNNSPPEAKIALFKNIFRGREDVRRGLREGRIINIRMCLTDETGDEDPWTLPPSQKRMERTITDPLPEEVEIVHGDLIYVEKAGMPSALITRLFRLAAFQNPEFFRAQAMRLPTYNKPRIICCAEDFPKHIGLPRGCLDEVLALLQAQGVKIKTVDARFKGTPIEVNFKGELRPPQEKAVRTISGFESTGFSPHRPPLGKQ